MAWTKTKLAAGCMIALIFAAVAATVVVVQEACGEAATQPDLARPVVPDKENAVWYLKQAAEAVDREHDGPRNSSMDYGRGLPYPPEWDRMAQEMMQANARVLYLAWQARTCRKVDWGIRFDRAMEDVITAQLPFLNKQRALANVLCDAALYYHFHGNDAAAIEVTKDALWAADVVDESPFLVSHQVAVGLHAIAVEGTIQVLATGLTVEKAEHPSSVTVQHPASRPQVQALIRSMLDDKRPREQLRWTLGTERAYMLQQLAGQPRNDGDVAKLRGTVDELVKATDAPRFAQPGMAAKDDSLGLAATFGKQLELMHRSILMDRMAAVALAVRLYWNDKGAYPDSLQKLVPAYLPALPADPLAKADQPLGYLLAEGGKRPIV